MVPLACGVHSYMDKYWFYRDERKDKRMSRLLRYAPVSRKQFLLFRLNKVMKISLCMTVAALIGQCVGATVFLHTFSVDNILQPLFCNFFTPVLLWGFCPFLITRS